MSTIYYPGPPKTWGADRDNEDRDQSRLPKSTRRSRGTRHHLFKLSQTVRGLMNGQSNNVLEVTLEPNANVTTVKDDRIHPDSKILLTARTITAAAATGVYALGGDGEMTINHNATSETDREFAALFVG